MKKPSLTWCLSGVAAMILTACSSSTDVVTRANDTPVVNTSVAAAAQFGAATQETPMRVYLTGYSYWDNTPRGSARIAHPIVRRKAGGTGTYDDPVTIAVGHSKRGQRSTPDYQPGTRFYIESLRRYAIVEDVCGDGPRPQNGPCHVGYKGYPWLDIWVGGKNVEKSFVKRCMYRLTGLQRVIKNPRPDYQVVPGEISASGCAVVGRPTS